MKADYVYDGFTFDNTNVTTEMAAVESVLAQYYIPLMCGMAGDVDTAIATLRKQLDSAGIQTIYDELLKQAEAFAAERAE